MLWTGVSPCASQGHLFAGKKKKKKNVWCFWCPRAYSKDSWRIMNPSNLAVCGLGARPIECPGILFYTI